MAKKENIVETYLRPTECAAIIRGMFKAKRPVFLWGPPGVGKSDIIAQLGFEADRPVIDMRLILMDPTDIKGIPYYDPKTNTMRWAIPSDLPQPGETTLDNAILFLDEMNSAPASVQGAAYQLILNRAIGSYKLPDGVDIVAAGNRDTDKGVTYRMPSPLANRFVHLQIETNFEDWQQWALNNTVHPDVVGYLTQHKQNLFCFDPQDRSKAFATPRAWKFVSDILQLAGINKDHLLRATIAGTVGESHSYSFMQHMKYASQLPKPEDVLTGRVTDLKVEEISARYSLVVSMCYTLKEWLADVADADKKYTTEDWHKSVNLFFEYMMNNFAQEMVILGARTALREYQLPINRKLIPCFTKFFQEYGKFIVDSN
ncbi:ATPase [Pseudomonas phage sp. 30-3]|uniref:ATPase n=1 Tax=Pseudomonas phage vB_PaeM_PA5oct TaxID=2163605 RepID=A0A4Y5JU50_9CAUD|nr:ATPase [Pseudomonas phage vB_PaeM_PA5oct]WMI31880.1 hypothetical protein GBBBJNDB_00177 [Pseudomonas phage Callisto]WPK38810.1 ATPase [Pseudomonas phage Cassandra]WPK39331.1 ATPase [Pseudomonas phage Deifobo]WPK39843.1 ATPase [Pseudomonas phage Ettore]WPK40364.1 ATPase [Pseudomonas phage Paride]VOH54657.1 AAA ATPase [Pseudomonas phage vB_PaeM_MIJ3]BDR25711.1 ATPase [Pseudomonas phage sp. 30-2]BDR26203.1 ATPase [Pseudomonas phage sp. 30-3]